MNDTPAFDAIKKCIDEKKSFCFNAGAGSGKTYSLVQTVDYILMNYGNELKKNNQRIKVITYTNAAANEVKDRIGNTALLNVSTIHTWMWELINKFQTDLVEIHLKKIQDKIKEYASIIDSSIYKNDSILNNNIKNNKEFIDKFYKYRYLKANDFRKMFEKSTIKGEIPNVSKFIEYVQAFDRYQKHTIAQSKIKDKAPEYRKVEYTPFYNSDHLYRMEFSHDTLIYYSKSLIEKSNTLKRIIIDQYPYILVDEFQDTSPSVIEILKMIDNFSKNKCIIGYFGDTCQNIYDDGIGNKLNEVHTGLIEISKPINRRSGRKIVDLGNKIRNDNHKQQPYWRNTEGTIEAFYCTVDNDDIINSFIDEKVNEFSQDEKIHCLVLKNEFVANRSGFGKFYKLISSTHYYKINFNQTATEILSDDISKLGKVPLLLNKWMKLYSDIHNSKETINNYIPAKVYGGLNFYKLNQLREALKGVTSTNLKTFISGIFELAQIDCNIKEVVYHNIGDDYDLDYERLKSYIFGALYDGISDELIPEAQSNIDSILELDLSILMKWYNFRTNNITDRVQYHTFHGTKGLEYKNVIIILTNEFDREKKYYHDFFENGNIDAKFNAKRNLLYVAVTRAKENLKLLYVDPDFDDVKNNFEELFGRAVKWPN